MEGQPLKGTREAALRKEGIRCDLMGIGYGGGRFVGTRNLMDSDTSDKLPLATAKTQLPVHDSYCIVQALIT